MGAIGPVAPLALTAVQGRQSMYPALQLCSDVRRFQALAPIPKAQKDIIVIVVLYKRETNEVMRIAVWQNILSGAKIKDPIHHRTMDPQFDLSLHGLQELFEGQSRFLQVSWREGLPKDL